MNLDEEHAWETIFRKCKEQGLPADMAERFLPYYYIPQPKQIEYHRLAALCDQGHVRYIGNGGSRGSGKTTATFAQVALYDCQKWENLNCLFVRRVMRSAEDSFQQLAAQLLTEYPEADINTERIKFNNGSVINIAGLKDPRDVDKYVGLNYELMVIEEANQLDEMRIKMLLGSLRTGKLNGYCPRVYMNFNPGGPGMSYLKKTFIQPWRKGTETDTRFLSSGYKDNAFLDRGYVSYLENLDGMLGKMWRDGDFDVQSGMAFDIFNRDVYVVDDFDIPDDWIRVRGIDDGYTKPYCCLWIAQDPVTGRVVVYREDYGEGISNSEQAERIKALTSDSERISITYADPAMWALKNHSDSGVKSTSQIYADHGVYLSKGDNNRHSGVNKIRDCLRYKEDGKPGLYILSSCKNLIWQFENMPTSPRDPEDIDTTFEDHALDAFKYALSGIAGKPMRHNTERKNLTRHPLYNYYKD